MTRSQSHDRRRASLLTAALNLFSEHGFDTVSMDAVADLAGVSRATAFRYFAAKHDLVFANREAWTAELARLDATSAETDPLRRLEAVALGVATVIETDRDVSLAWHRVEQASSNLQQVAAAKQREWVDVAAGILSPALPADEARIAGAAVTALLFECFAVWAEAEGRTGLVELVSRSLPIVLDGLRAR